jgi:pSer/pThr/pTyr-binding forkhead associated (FHA) protein
MELYGRLRLHRPDEPDQSFILSKSIVSVGRAEINDIVLPDGRVSRTHARFEWGSSGYSVIDLGSANGTWVNERRITQTALAPDDTIRIGGSTFRFDLPRSRDTAGNTSADPPSAGYESVSLNVTLARTDLPRLAVTTPDDTWEVPLYDDTIAIGRDLNADIVLPYAQVSRFHAQVEYRNGRVTIRDRGSLNGTWLGNRRLDEYQLSAGETVRIGPAHLTFAAGFGTDELSDALQSAGAARGHKVPIVFVPGFMGSELWRGSDRIWPAVRYPLSQPEIYRLPDTTPLEPRAVAGEVVIVPGLIKLDRYNRVADYLIEALGYERGKDVLEFPYDWRQDVRDSAMRLGRAIEEWPVRGPITIIAHSMGCLVSRWYVEKLGGRDKVGRMVLLGGPHLGAPRAVTTLVPGARLLPFGLAGDRLTETFATFPSTYQLLPWGNAGTDEDGSPLNLFDDDRWLPENSRPLLRAARDFRRRLGLRSSVPAVSIFGYGLKTMTGLRVRRNEDRRWERVEFDVEPGGDETVPQASAILPGSEIHPVRQNHGALYVDSDVKMRLKLELLRDTARLTAR